MDQVVFTKEEVLAIIEDLARIVDDLSSGWRRGQFLAA